jgi:hypothetical protein
MDAVLDEVGLMIEPYPYGSWGPDCYRIMHDVDAVLIWLHQNRVDYWTVSTGSNGYVIQIKSDTTMFNLRWS